MVLCISTDAPLPTKKKRKPTILILFHAYILCLFPQMPMSFHYLTNALSANPDIKKKPI